MMAAKCVLENQGRVNEGRTFHDEVVKQVCGVVEPTLFKQPLEGRRRPGRRSSVNRSGVLALSECQIITTNVNDEHPDRLLEILDTL